MKNYVKEVHKGRKILTNFLKKNIEVIGKYSNTVLFELESFTKVKE